MGKIIEQKIDTFSGGLSEDKRVQDFSKFSITKHFDVFTYPHKLVPHNKTAACDGENKDLNIVKFLYSPTPYDTGLSPTRNYILLGLGTPSGTATTIAVYMNRLDGSGWLDAGTKNKGTLSNRNKEVFFYYKNFVYMFAGGTDLCRFDTRTTNNFQESYEIAVYETVAQPVHHPSDDYAYFFHDNYVSRLVAADNDGNGSDFTKAVLTLPDNLYIASACPFGNYLAIGCVTKPGNVDSAGSFDVRSIVYLWDRDSSLTTLTERIDFGEGTLVHLVCLNNKLIGVMSFYADTAYGNKKGKVLIKQASGLFAVTLNEITLDATMTAPDPLPKTRFLRDDKLYFPMKATLNGDDRLGIWVVDSLGRVALSFVEEEATSYEGIYALGNVWFIAHSDDGSVNNSVKDGSYSTTNPSIYESLILNGGDSSKTKKLIGVTVFHEPLPTAGSVVLKYRKDEETAWTTIFTHSTDNSISHSAINIESNGNNLPEYKEIQFQISSFGGSVICGLKYKSEIIEKDVY